MVNRFSPIVFMVTVQCCPCNKWRPCGQQNQSTIQSLLLSLKHLQFVSVIIPQFLINFKVHFRCNSVIQFEVYFKCVWVAISCYIYIKYSKYFYLLLAFCYQISIGVFHFKPRYCIVGQTTAFHRGDRSSIPVSTSEICGGQSCSGASSLHHCSFHHSYISAPGMSSSTNHPHWPLEGASYLTGFNTDTE